jgi:multiple sugar transport system substrate-binding protein
MSKLSRRQFLKTAGAALVSGTMLNACAVPQQGSTQPDQAAPSQEGITLKVMHVHGLYDKFGAEAVDPAFTELNPNVTVERELVPGWLSEYYPKLSAMTAAGESFDAAQIPYAPIVYALYSKGVFQSLEPFISVEGFNMEKFFQSTVEGATHPNGEIFMLPLLLDDGMSVMLYNKDALLEAGLEEPKHGTEWTWHEYEAWAKEANDKITNMIPVYHVWDNWAAIESLFHAWNGARFLDDEGRTCLINQEDQMACLRFFHNAQEQGWNARPSQLGGYDRTLFMGGTIAVTSDFYPTAVTVKNMDLSFEPGSVQLPKGPGPNGNVPGIGNMHFMGVGGLSTHPAVAWDYIKFFASEEFAEETWQIGIPLPIQSVWTGEWVADPLTQAVISSMNTVRPPSLPWNFRSNEIHDAYSQNISAVIEGQVSLEDGVDAALGAIEAILAKPPA